MSKLILRIQNKDGLHRIQTTTTTTLQELIQTLKSNYKFTSILRNPKDKLDVSNLSVLLGDIMENGDKLFLQQEQEVESLDQSLANKDYKIQKEKDQQLCNHSSDSKCVHCTYLNPWEVDKSTKHLSFHCYARKLLDEKRLHELENISCKIKECSNHSPWPTGICTKCQPKSITLKRQPYRHVDNIMFEHPSIVDNFINAWRQSGMQRIGFLLGYYTEYKDVPLGIRAVVRVIYEPPQECSKYSVELLKDPYNESMLEVASALDLQIVGWIFTDLNQTDGKIAYKRSIHTHLLTAEECIMAAEFQNQYPNKCNYINDNFGSKFVTVCISGDEQNQIDIKGYQISNQCMALVRDNCMVPTIDCMELGYIKESTNEQYVPDVFYFTDNEYGKIIKMARPLPLDYLIIELTTSTPSNVEPLPIIESFPIENRMNIGQSLQDFTSLRDYIIANENIHFINLLDFHILFYFHTSEVANMIIPTLQLCELVKNKDIESIEQWCENDPWVTIQQLIYASRPVSNNIQEQWQCEHCTLYNTSEEFCEACGLPRLN